MDTIVILWLDKQKNNQGVVFYTNKMLRPERRIARPTGRISAWVATKEDDADGVVDAPRQRVQSRWEGMGYMPSPRCEGWTHEEVEECEM